jgi:hypothetical protein
MTDTELKIKDAGIQMKLALKQDSDDEFRSCINSFISFARSVTLVMQKESSGYPELEGWYKVEMDQLKKMSIMLFFNEMRVITIHKGHIKPSKTTGKGDQFHIAGVPVQTFVIGEKQIPAGECTLTIWRFDGTEKYFPGENGNVNRLCREYFLILKKLVLGWLGERKRLGLPV